MRLLSATVRNYRIHREVEIDFDQARTLIGGPNESGKSTFIEALHRGLFLKSTITGAGQKSMVSSSFPGHPEVEIRFVVNDKEYRLAKRFSGASGTAQLVQAGGQTWRGEEAEARLANLLRVEELGGGRGILNRVWGQWAHLWVWQGMSGDDPAAHAISEQASLVQQLQQIGGAVAIQSKLDGRVASRFAVAKDQIFVRAGKARSGSDLDQAQTEAQQAEQEQADASSRLDRLQQAVIDFEKASATIELTKSDLENLSRERKIVEERISRAEELRGVEKERASTVNATVEQLANLETIEKNIDGLRQSVAALKKSLGPKREKEKSLELAVSNGRKKTNDAEKGYEEALNKTREVRLRRELAAAYVSRFEKEARNNELQKRLERVQTLEKDIAGHREQLARLSTIDQKGLAALQRLESESAQASAALNAMAAEVEVVESDRAVRIGDSELGAGQSQTVTESTEVRIGDLICLRIHPGGGDSLANARENLRTLRENFRRSLDEYGLESVAIASEIVARRTDLQSKLINAESELKESDAENLVEECRSAREELATVEAEVNRRMDQVVDAERPETLSDAKAWRDREENALQSLESDETGLKAAQGTFRKEQGDLEDKLTNLRDTIAGEKQELTGTEAQLNLLLESHGDDQARAQALTETRQAKINAEAALGESRRSLESLQPDLLEADRKRLQRAWEELERQRQDAHTTRAVNQAALQLDGTADPSADLARAQARLEAATEHLSAVSRKAQAIALVDKLFQQEQRALSDRFSQPLAQRITGYLQCLFGQSVQAVVTFEDNAFKAIRLVRSDQGGAISFDDLSGGTREQVAAAVRLAIAELLAADHDNSLPIVFDDAFAYSDPERVNTLQRMLDLGASRGLQIIVLTCNPSDYAALGARQIILKPAPLPAASHAGTSAPHVDEDSSGLETADAEPSVEAVCISDEDSERFVSALSDLGSKCGNQSLRKTLGWDEVKYTAVKDQLISQGRIVPGKGRGGSVALAE